MVKWELIETVLLDMDGTLLDLHFDNYFWLQHLPARYAELKGISTEQSRLELHSSYDQMRGTLDWYCLDYWSNRLQMDMLELKREVAHKIQLRPHAEQFLQWLRNQGKEVLLITNAHPTSVELKMTQVPIDHHFDAVVTSHEFRAPKEDNDFWLQLNNKHRFDPAKTLFIDDTESVLHSAQKFGIAHLLCIVQPDSKQAERHITSYPAVNSFAELLG